MFLQLALFFTVTAISLWADQLRTSEIAVLAMHPALYYALFIFTVVVCPFALWRCLVFDTDLHILNQTIVPWIICVSIPPNVCLTQI